MQMLGLNLMILLTLAGCGKSGSVNNGMVGALVQKKAVSSYSGTWLKTVTTNLLAGDADCSNGGTQVESFLDLNANGLYDAASDTDHVIRKLCNARSGSSVRSIVVSTEVQAGDTTCTQGGMLTERFDDQNDNTTYEAALDLNHFSKKICKGSNAVIVASDVSVAGTECPNLGGSKIETFIDKNDNGLFDAGVDASRLIKVTCKQPSREVTTSDIAAGDTSCVYGGKLLRFFVDINGNKLFDSTIDADYSESKVCNAKDGYVGLVKQTTLAIGDTHCAMGGTLVESFIDVNGNGTYESSVDLSYTAKPLCNGATGKTPMILQSQLATDDADCPGGNGFLYETFIDTNANETYDSGVDSNHLSSKVCSGSNTVVLSSVISAGDVTCAGGGTLLKLFTDVNRNGTYEVATDTDYSERKVCHGLQGSASKIIKTALGNGHATCSFGGAQYEAFTDVNGNETYEVATDTNYSIQLICNGQNGGTNGSNAVVLKTVLNVGDLSCANGGAKHETFTDVNGNGSYDAGTDQNYNSVNVCNGINGLNTRMTLTAFGTGTGNCAGRSGVTVQSWLDKNSNATYDAGTESDTLITSVVCDGATGATGATGAQGDTGATGAAGSNGTNGTNGAAGATGATGADGVSRGFKIDLVAPGVIGAVTGQAGVNCTAGGLKFTSWTEIGTPNNTLEAGEVASSFSSYTCNPRPLLNRTTQFAVDAGTATDNTNCPAGGIRLEYGYDDFDTGAGVLNALDTAEVNASLTKYVCNGVDAGRNLIINGAMRLSQRYAGGSVTTAVKFPVDRFVVDFVGGGVMTSNRDATVAPSGFTHALKLTASTIDAAIAASDYYVFMQKIEGFNAAPLMLGTAAAQPFTISFWVRSSATGIYSLAYRNVGGLRSFVTTYTIALADTWEKKTVTISGDTTGTWLKDNGSGLEVIWSLGAGATFSTATTNSWQAGNYFSTTGVANWIGSLNNTFYLTGVQLEKGSGATAFEYRSIQDELSLAQRYYAKSYALETAVGAVSSVGLTYGSVSSCACVGNATATVRFPVQMRTSPSAGTYDLNGNNGWMRDSGASVSGTAITGAGPGSFAVYNSGTALTVGAMFHFQWWADAEL